MGDCWGTIGGAINRGMSPQQSAVTELEEETGYSGPIKIINAYVFSSGKFKYYNFLGVVAQEFGFHPSSGHSWETESIEWMDYSQALQEIEGGKAHMGVKALFENSRDLIEKLLL